LVMPRQPLRHSPRPAGQWRAVRHRGAGLARRVSCGDLPPRCRPSSRGRHLCPGLAKAVKYAPDRDDRS
jgi:hypothetical protein